MWIPWIPKPGISKKSRIYWSKLEDAYIQLKGVKVAGGFSGFEKLWQEEEKDTALEGDLEKQNLKEGDVIQNANDQELREKGNDIPDAKDQIKDILTKEEHRKQALNIALKSLQIYSTKLKKLDELKRSGKSNTNEYKQEKELAGVLYEEFKRNWEKLSEANKDMPERAYLEKLLNYRNKETRDKVQLAGKITNYSVCFRTLKCRSIACNY